MKRLDFMLIGLPRSGTTWAANWLTTTNTFCLHDPLHKMHYSEFDGNEVHFPNQDRYKSIGVACTGLWRFPDYVNRHPARKIVVTRDIDDIQNSLEEIGFAPINSDAPYMLDEIEGPRITYEDLFNPYEAAKIWEALTLTKGFCPTRHRALTEMHLEPHFEEIHINIEARDRLMKELYSRV